MSGAPNPALPRPLDPDASFPVALHDDVLDTPAVLVDLDVVERNLRTMQDFADAAGFALRPHVKSHKSRFFAEQQLALGAAGVCVSSATEAEVMAATSAPSVLIAYPLVGRTKLERLSSLAYEGRLALAADSVDVAEGYGAFAQRLGVELPVFVDIDTGMHRTGVPPEDVSDVALRIAKDAHLSFAGIMTHAGHAHDVATEAEIAAVGRAEGALMGSVREDLERLGLDVPAVSAGSTITSRYLRASDGVTEIRPGTYIFNDLRTMGRFACTLGDIAPAMLSTVVSVRSGRVTLDAGAKTLTTTRDPQHAFGTVCEWPGATVTRLSEEHGVVDLGQVPSDVRVGDRVRLRPIHACVWMDLQCEVYGTRGGRIEHRISVDAMRHSL